MSKLKIIYAVSLLILGLLLVFTVFRPMVSGEKYSEVNRESIIQQEDKWIIQVDILNREGKVTDYIINWSTGDDTRSQRVGIKDGRMFTYIHYVYPATVKEGQVKLEIYKEGEATPLEEATYYINFDQESSSG